jgi:hypothetical protein
VAHRHERAAGYERDRVDAIDEDDRALFGAALEAPEAKRSVDAAGGEEGLAGVKCDGPYVARVSVEAGQSHRGIPGLSIMGLMGEERAAKEYAGARTPELAKEASDFATGSDRHGQGLANLPMR